VHSFEIVIFLFTRAPLTQVDVDKEGSQVMIDLRRQRDVIQKVGDNLSEADSIYGKVRLRESKCEFQTMKYTACVFMPVLQCI
jgi:hypothetical protein